MRNPFSRKQKPKPGGELDHEPAGLATDIPEPAAPAAGARPVRAGADIADIQLMGSTAVATLTVTELTAEDGAEQLAYLLQDLTESGARHFVLDIQNVQYMDSACLGCLVEFLNRMAASGGRIALANTAHRVQYLFRLTRLDRVFPICKDVMAALEAVERAA